MKIEAFCAKCQKDTLHEATVDKNDHLVLQCECKHFIKTAKLSPDALRARLEAHKKENAGKVFLTPAQIIEQAKPDTYLETLSTAGLVK